MEHFDSQRQQQIWQRVRSGREEAPKNDLRQMHREALELAAIYRSLASRMTSRQQQLLSMLYRGERENAAALAGIAVLSRLGGETLNFWQPDKEEPKRLLERCYHRTRRCMTEYLARSAEGEWGVVYEKMAGREGEHCFLIARLLGWMQ